MHTINFYAYDRKNARFHYSFYGLGMNPLVIGIDKINTMMKNQRGFLPKGTLGN